MRFDSSTFTVRIKLCALAYAQVFLSPLPSFFRRSWSLPLRHMLHQYKKNMLRQHWRESYLCMNGRRDAADKDAYDRIFLLVVQTSEIPSMSCGTRKESAACVSFHWFAQESVQIRFVRKSASQSLSHIQMRCCDGYRKFLVGEMAFSKSIHSSRNDVVFKLARSQYWNAITCTLAMRR